jgi:hypothetical protein
MHIDLRLREIPAPQVPTLQLNAAIRTLQRITNRKEVGESKHFKNLKEELKLRLMNPRRGATFEQTTAVIGRERLLLSLYLEHTGRTDTSWLPPFDETTAESVLGSDGGEWHAGRRRQAVQLFFTHFDALPALYDLCSRLLESFADSEAHPSSAVNVWHQKPATIFAVDGPQKVANSARKGETLPELMNRFALPKDGRFSARLKECFLLTRLESVELGQGQEILAELEGIRNFSYQGGVPMGAAALRIMIRRVLKGGGNWKGDWRDWILRLGCDPALPSTSEVFGKWWGCWHPTREELDCAQRAVNRQTLEYFIQFLEQSLRGKQGQEQFESRAGFLRWLDDTGKIQHFKLLLHPSAYLALPNAYRQQRHRVAQIEGSGQGTSVIVMQCTDDIWIVEGTHIFAIRVFINNFPVTEVFSENRRSYSYSSFTQGAMHRDHCSGIWKPHMGDWLHDLLWQIRYHFHVEW